MSPNSSPASTWARRAFQLYLNIHLGFPNIQIQSKLSMTRTYQQSIFRLGFLDSSQNAQLLSEPDSAHHVIIHFFISPLVLVCPTRPI